MISTFETFICQDGESEEPYEEERGELNDRLLVCNYDNSFNLRVN